MSQSPFIPIPSQSLGKEQGQGQGLKTNQGFFGDRDNPKFWDLFEFIPKNPQILGLGSGLQLLRCLGTLQGGVNPKFWGFFWGNPPKSPNFGMETGEGILGIFQPLTCRGNLFRTKLGT